MIEQKIEQLKVERKYLSWLLQQYTERRLSGHRSRLEHLSKMLDAFPVAKVRDLYYTTSDKLTGEDNLFWNHPDLWVEYKLENL